jgi:hypothetical protein
MNTQFEFGCLACGAKFVTEFRQQKYCFSLECARARANERAKVRAKIPRVHRRRIAYGRKYRKTQFARLAERSRRAKQRAELNETYIRFLLCKDSKWTRKATDFTTREVRLRRQAIQKERERRIRLHHKNKTNP